MANKVYAFQDVDAVLSHPAMGQLVLSGSGEEKGVGQLLFSFANDKTVHDNAADGRTMTSKIHVKNGTCSIEVQQISEAQEWLERWDNYVSSKSTPSNEYNQLTLTMRHATTGETINCEGGAPQKTPDKTYQAQGQRVTWPILFEEMIYEPGASNG